MTNQIHNSEAQNLVERILSDNDTRKIRELSTSIEDDNKKNVIDSIKRLDMSPLSTTSVQ